MARSIHAVESPLALPGTARTPASLTTRSSSAMYSKNRFRPVALSLHKVCGRLLVLSFRTSTRLASCSICKCRLKLPSVSVHRPLRSLNSNPSGCAANDDIMPSRALLVDHAFQPIVRETPG